MRLNMYLCFCDISSIIFSVIFLLFKGILLNMNIADMQKFWSVHFGEFSHQKQQNADLYAM